MYSNSSSSKCTVLQPYSRWPVKKKLMTIPMPNFNEDINNVYTEVYI